MVDGEGDDGVVVVKAADDKRVVEVDVTVPEVEVTISIAVVVGFSVGEVVDVALVEVEVTAVVVVVFVSSEVVVVWQDWESVRPMPRGLSRTYWQSTWPPPALS